MCGFSTPLSAVAGSTELWQVDLAIACASFGVSVTVLRAQEHGVHPTFKQEKTELCLAKGRGESEWCVPGMEPAQEQCTGIDIKAAAFNYQLAVLTGCRDVL